ncbi:hypothetical protein COHA_009529 [Chlorella ohadii]|uniref:Uncharacterized protein n=1 Tax=Chlorella ohadii TaxID=2649997 RepID=A0AAD5GY26_9CHLO|nr:hypothetical protein COHA_009529 [Chlorella ohadii]
MRRNPQRPPPVQADAWGSESDSEQDPSSSSSKHAPLRAAPSKTATPGGRSAAATAAPPRVLAASAASAAALPLAGARGAVASRVPDSLRSICLGVLAEHLEDLLEDSYCCEHILPYLPSEAKACLLAVARLRRLLCDAALLLLADECQTTLDLHGCGEAVSSGGIEAALRRMPHLRQVDLTSCPVGAATLRVLGQCCPAVEQLRLGSRVTDETAGRGLKDILPALEQRHQAPAAESWDTLLEVDDAAQLTAAVAGAGRLMQLQCVHWPSVPFRLAEHCKTACPQVALNPSAEEVARRRLPAACDPAAELDAPRLAEVSGSARWAAAAGEPPGEPVLHIAERFRLAYVSRQNRVRAVMARNRAREQRAEKRAMGQGERLIAAWESELRKIGFSSASSRNGSLLAHSRTMASAAASGGLQMEMVEVDNGGAEELNFILGQAHFIKTVEDIAEALFQSGTAIKFGVAFCEASGDRKIRFDGNDEGLIELAKKNALAVGAGHSFIIFLKDAYPVNVLKAVQGCPTVCRIYCATANPTAVVIGKDGGERRGILGVLDGFCPLGVENEADITARKDLLRMIGYKR